MSDILHRVIAEHRAALDALVEQSLRQAADASDMIVGALESGGTIFVAGNGGSAADAQHLAAEIVGRFVDRLRPALPSVALTTDSSLLTAIANDFGFENVFSRQLEGLSRPGDVFIGITTSGKSPNILRALTRAKELRLKTILLTGPDASAAAESADVIVRIPHPETARVQELHLMVYHAWCEAIDKRFSVDTIPST